MTGKTVVQINDVTFKYGDSFAIKNISFDCLGNSNVVGLLGPAGSGKSTLLDLIFTNKKPSEGEIFVLGQNTKLSSEKIKNKIGYSPADPIYDSELTLRENLECFALYQAVSKVSLEAHITELIHLLELEKYEDQYIQSMSYDLQKRASLGLAIVHQPDILLLDEPFTHLDIKNKNWQLEFINQFKKNFKAIIIAEQDPQYFNSVCDYLILMHKGVFLDSGDPQKLIKSWIGSELVEITLRADEHPYFLHKLKENGFISESWHDKILVSLTSEQHYKQVIDLVPSKSVTIKKPNVVDLYNKLIGEFA